MLSQHETLRLILRLSGSASLSVPDWEGAGGQGASHQKGPTPAAAGPEVNIMRLLLAWVCSLAGGFGKMAKRALILSRVQDLEFCSYDS